MSCVIEPYLIDRDESIMLLSSNYAFKQFLRFIPIIPIMLKQVPMKLPFLTIFNKPSVHGNQFSYTLTLQIFNVVIERIVLFISKCGFEYRKNSFDC